MNKHGITMISVVVIIIVMIIIATVSMIAGNRVILNAKEYNQEKELETVKAAIIRKKTEVNNAGIITPLGESYVGTKNPTIKSDETGEIIADGWYFLDEAALEQLGVMDSRAHFLVNYENEIALRMDEEDYIEPYTIATLMIQANKTATVFGEALKDNEPLQMIENEEDNEFFGTGWYYVNHTADLSGDAINYVQNDYLINFEHNQFIKMTDAYKRVEP